MMALEALKMTIYSYGSADIGFRNPPSEMGGPASGEGGDDWQASAMRDCSASFRRKALSLLALARAWVVRPDALLDPNNSHRVDQDVSDVPFRCLTLAAGLVLSFRDVIIYNGLLVHAV